MSKKGDGWKKFLWGNDEEDDVTAYSYKPTYSYGFNRPLFTPAEKEADARKEMEESAKRGDFFGAIKALNRMRKVKDDKTQEADSERERKAAMEEYNKTGVWTGYNHYSTPRVDSRYIEQIANALAARYKIDVVPGDGWKVDLKTKTLTYDPDTLLTSTKGRMLASLLHEIGHIRHTTPSSELKSDYLTKYDTKAHHVVNLFEDLRIDTIMARSYGSGEDIYDENKPIVRSIAEGYAEKSKYVREEITKEVAKQLMNYGVEADVVVNSAGTKEIFVREAMYAIVGKDPKDIEALMKTRKKVFGTETVDDEFKAKVKTMFEGLINMDTLEDYSAGILLLGYGEELPPALQPKMQARIDMTKHAIPLVKVMKSTQEMTDLLNTDVYPVIEDLLKQQEELENLLKEVFSDSVAQQIAGEAMGRADMLRRGEKAEGDPKKVDARESRNSGRGQDVPPEWRSGDYAVLAESVKFEVKRLVERLKLLKKQEDITSYTNDHKRGKLSTKSLYRFASGNMRLFKKKEETIKTVDSHAFSVVVDSSGSMYPNYIAHATRASVLFAEVFKQMDIPFEVIAFDTSAKVLKSLDKPLDKKSQDLLAGLPARSGGGSTNLYTAIKETKIVKSPKANKMMIIISDGGVGDFGYYDNDKKMFASSNVKLFGVSIDSGPEIVKFCGDGVEVKKIRTLPDEFSKIIRGSFKGGKRKSF